MTAITLTIATGLVAGGSWLAMQLIINPGAGDWFSQFLPGWNSAHVMSPQTLTEIEAKLHKTGLASGQPIHFSTYPGMTLHQVGFHDLLLPVLKAQDCSNQPVCSQIVESQIVELRIYRPTSRPVSPGSISYELVDRIAITGLEELTAIAPLARQSSLNQGSSRVLPFTKIAFVEGFGEGKAAAGIWFHLYGEWQRGSRVLYGQVMHYDLERQHLYGLQSWSSPAGQLPYWQWMAHRAMAELVVNQSIGSDPQFQVYQLQPARSLEQAVSLEAISLNEAALKDRAYEEALLLARHGLWSPALLRLNQLKQQGNWSKTAAAQLDLVTLHAKVTQAQAERDWASPSQQILAQVADGRWSKALSLVKAAHQSGDDVASLLQANADQLWRQIEAAIQVDPNQADLRAWGVLMLAIRQNRTQAINWLRRQPHSAPNSATANRLAAETLALLDPAAEAAPTAKRDSFACFIGAVTPIPTVQPTDWIKLTPEPISSAPQKSSPQKSSQWYRIDLLGWQQGQQWQNRSADLTSGDLRRQLRTRLGLADFQLQIAAWQGTTLAQAPMVALKAARWQAGQLSLLAVGDALPSSLQATTIVAITPNTIRWAQPSSSRTLAELAAAPGWQPQLISQLWQNLQTAHLVTAKSADQPLQTIGGWVAQMMQLTDDQRPEGVLTLETAHATPRTVIFSQPGKILYSDLETPDRTLVAIAERVNSSLPVLILNTARGVEIKQWSKQQQRFE